MNRIWVSGYRNYELGVFDNKSPKALIIKLAIKEQLKQLIENGCEWIITGVQLGTEQWTIEIANQLKEEYPNQFKIGIMLPFKDFGKKWNEANQIQMQHLLSIADFSASVSDHPYESPQQLKNYQTFMLTHTDGALFLYDTDNEGKTMYDYNATNYYMKNHNYTMQIIDFDDLQETANELQSQTDDDNFS
ncbi:hypothetical protein BGL34_01305 [Fructilactobacillus lindneri]|uniref:UPF0398 protein IV52_GL000418 n=2 Tax=Fructilactobacillus lindneri TaxID=53444 RepID=A0A0R2JUI2_9LACO|nr:DUF1273 domain-containing protein [Fructilactobacillus lindneri]ANZ58189.1 hypothetical protein AYR60_05280 [Fructilactobacillus lindneri]ANZ59510.1 hypothetical protein AYR59_05535 [Fructilactobacillus lindneri]KRN79013.1 hypothetical protein IV52_GL000418 [Fructilactobacillus lindneri DSM 20690 = JCM 11027]POG98706.1 hypothetical protein BGL31_01895 [Fructilactobacillus lindneri]POH04094.1 hypothetical protein BGL32_01835 [Fructilactobacillus lindneri]